MAFAASGSLPRPTMASADSSGAAIAASEASRGKALNFPPAPSCSTLRVLDRSRTSWFLAHSSPAPCLIARFCSYGRGFDPSLPSARWSPSAPCGSLRLALSPSVITFQITSSNAMPGALEKPFWASGRGRNAEAFLYVCTTNGVQSPPADLK